MNLIVHFRNSSRTLRIILIYTYTHIINMINSDQKQSKRLIRLSLIQRGLDHGNSLHSQQSSREEHFPNSVPWDLWHKASSSSRSKELIFNTVEKHINMNALSLIESLFATNQASSFASFSPSSAQTN